MALLQDVHAFGRLDKLPPCFAVFTSADDGCGVGVTTAIVVRKSLQPLRVQVDGMCCSLNWCGRNVFVATACCTQTGLVTSRHLDDILQFQTVARNDPLILGMDANATNRRWYSKDCANGVELRRPYANGKRLSELFATNRLHVVNRPTLFYTFVGIGDGNDESRDGCITVVNDAWRRMFETTWKLRIDRTTSQYNLIEMNVSMTSLEACDCFTNRTTRDMDESITTIVHRTSEATTCWSSSIEFLRIRNEMRTIRHQWQTLNKRWYIERNYERQRIEYERVILAERENGQQSTTL